MSERFYTAENVLDLVIRVYNVGVLKHKTRDEIICSAVFPSKDGGMTMVNAGTAEDHYDILYSLLYKIAETKRDGKLPDNVMALREDEAHPIDVAIDLREEKHLMEQAE